MVKSDLCRCARHFRLPAPTAFNYDYALARQLLADTDADGDGYGNICDADLNNNGTTNAQDYAILRSKLGTTDPVADLNGSGLVNAQDYAILRARLGTAPGPSAYAP